MRHGPSDTSPEVDRLMHEAYRRMPPARKWKNLVQDFRTARTLHEAGMRHRNPDVSVREIQADWIRSLLGHPSPVPIPERLVDPIDQDFQPVFRYTVRTLERLGIAYAVGGSIASALHGVGRTTRDADLTVEPFFGREAVFVAAFDPADFYLSPESVRDALRDRSTFNILHPATGFKIDIFVRKDEPFERSAFARRGPYVLPDVPSEPIQLHSPEDIILFKLRWYRLGGGVSDRQWNDVLGVMKTQRDRLDAAYLDTWATNIGVKDLLDAARAEV